MQGPQLSRCGQAAQPRAARRSVDAARIPALKRARQTAAASRLPQHLRASSIHRRTLGHALCGARRAPDGLQERGSAELWRQEDRAKYHRAEQLQEDAAHSKAIKCKALNGKEISPDACAGS